MAGVSYRVLLSEKSYLKVKLRAMQLQGVFIEEIYYSKKDILFKTRSGTDPSKIWYQTFRMEDLRNLANLKDVKNLDEVIRNSGLKVHCTCPAWQFWGFKYMAWKGGYGLAKETRVPKVRNPQQRGYACKHVYQAAMVYPFLAKQIAAKLRRFYQNVDDLKNNAEDKHYPDNRGRATQMMKLKRDLDRHLKRDLEI
jgi:hypothetical protein